MNFNHQHTYFDKKRLIKSARIKYISSLLNFITLSTIEKEEISGYDLMAYIHEKFKVFLGAGTLYPKLKSLEKNGFIEGITEGRSRVYRITIKGKDFLNSLSAEYGTISDISPLFISTNGPITHHAIDEKPNEEITDWFDVVSSNTRRQNIYPIHRSPS